MCYNIIYKSVSDCILCHFISRMLLNSFSYIHRSTLTFVFCEAISRKRNSYNLNYVKNICVCNYTLTRCDKFICSYDKNKKVSLTEACMPHLINVFIYTISNKRI